jgi:hypothetical protein
MAIENSSSNFGLFVSFHENKALPTSLFLGTIFNKMMLNAFFSNGKVLFGKELDQKLSQFD